MMTEQEMLYTLALTRMTGFSFQTALQLYLQAGGGQAVYEHRHDIRAVMPDCSERLATALQDWGSALARAEHEMAFIQKHHIQVLCHGDDRYPARLADCPDSPIVLYYLGTASLNQQQVINLVGTRRCTTYGQDLIQHFIADLRQLCPQVLIVSGLAYGIDICAHRQALSHGFDSVGVLAHGLDDLYPPRHRETALQMVSHGGLLTEYMSQTEPMANNFRMRNRIVAGMSDATIVVESANRGGALITARIALDYGRDVMAFPGPVGAPYSEGCNNLIRDNKAQLITSASDFIEFMGWQTAAQLHKAKSEGIERTLFPELTAEEQTVVEVLRETGDQQLNVLSVKANVPIGKLTAILFQLELKGVVRPIVGGSYHLLV